MNNPDNSLISGAALKKAAAEYRAQINEPLGIFDKWFMRVMARLSADPNAPWEDIAAQDKNLAWDFMRLRLFLDRWRQGRFVSYEQRELSGIHYTPKYGTEFGIDVLLTCQGAPSCMQWRDLPLMKTAFDFAIYPQLLAELRPQTIFEIGSGAGASAMWLADHLALLNLPTHIHSVDREKVSAAQPRVTFHQGDCAQPEKLFAKEILSAAPHPWLVIEDAHHNVANVLEYFHAFLQPGDYLYVEDSEIKREDIRRFLAKHPDSYMVDTKFTDFFGRNATCAMDSILVRMR